MNIVLIELFNTHRDQVIVLIVTTYWKTPFHYYAMRKKTQGSMRKGIYKFDTTSQ